MKMQHESSEPPIVCFVEPFYGGSHAQIEPYIRAAATARGARFVSCTLPARKWGWRLAAGALWAAGVIPRLPPKSIVFVSAMLNVAELLGLRRDLETCEVILYFHENQLEYPVRTVVGTALGAGTTAAGDLAASTVAASTSDGTALHWARGWAQLVSVLSADIALYNSSWNLDSFVARIPTLLRAIPGAEQRPSLSNIVKAVYDRAIVVGVPVTPRAMSSPPTQTSSNPQIGFRQDRLRVAWPHRWEFDKAPQIFFDAVLAAGVTCDVILLGQGFSSGDSDGGADCADFASARSGLEAAGRLVTWGAVNDREEYLNLLSTADVVVSTAVHEFFGVSTVEGIFAGAWPLVPQGLAYDELISPDDRESARLAGAKSRAARLRSQPPQAFDMYAGFSSSRGGAREDTGAGGADRDDPLYAPAPHARLWGQGAGAPYKPASRQCPHFYRDGASGLAKALKHLQANIPELRIWREALSTALSQEVGVAAFGGGGGGDCGGAGKRARDEATKSSIFSTAGASSLAAAVLRAAAPSSLTPVFEVLLTPKP